MLDLSRKLGQAVIINDTVEIAVVVAARDRSIKLGFAFPSRREGAETC